MSPCPLSTAGLAASTTAPTATPVRRTGRAPGPGVILIHELPGITPDVVAFGDEVVAAGFTVVMPVLFGTPGRRCRRVVTGPVARAGVHERRVHQARDAADRPVTDWLRSLARELHAELGGPGVGALGMCFTGGYALAMMVDEPLRRPCWPSPRRRSPVGKRRAADLGLSSADQDAVVARAEAGCPVLGIRYAEDKAVGTRFETLHRLLGDRFLAVDLPGKGHATLTEHRSQEAVDRVLAFFGERLRA